MIGHIWCAQENASEGLWEFGDYYNPEFVVFEYHAALNVMTADCDTNLCKFELSKKEWGMATELCEVLQVCVFFSLFLWTN